MLSPNFVESNKKLDEQIIKLRECKAEMIKMFHDIDSLIDNSPHSSFCSYSHSLLGKSNSNLYEISSSGSNYSESDSEYNSDYYQPSDYREPTRRPSLKFSFKFPLQSEYDNISTYSSYTPENSQKYNYDQYARIPSTKQNKKPKKENNRSFSSLCRPKSQTNMNHTFWKPVGRVMSKSAIFSSSQDLSKFKKGPQTDYKDVGKGWKPTLGKSREDLSIYSNSTYEKNPFKSVTVKKKVVTDPKDIGRGWKNILSKSKNDLNIYARPEPEKEPFKTVIVKKKVVRDPRDIGKDVEHRKKSFKPAYSSDYDKEPFKSVTVKRKIFKDEKDVGNGWKPICGKSKDDLKKLYEEPAIPEVEKKIIKENKNAGKTWKPNGKVKPDNPFKADLIRPVEKEINQKKIIKDENNSGKDWKPNGRVKPDNPYKFNEDKKTIINIFKLGANKESKIKSKPPIEKKYEKITGDKSKLNLNLEKVDAIIQDEDGYKTSTPNISKKIEENELQESIIRMESNDLIENREELEDELNLESKRSLEALAHENVKLEESKNIEENENIEEKSQNGQSIASAKSNLENDENDENGEMGKNNSERSQTEKEADDKEEVENQLSNGSYKSRSQNDENGEMGKNNSERSQTEKEADDKEEVENQLSNESKKFDLNGQDNNELGIKNETERQSEINDEENLADNNSEIKEENLEQVEEREASKTNESLKLTETNDENKPDDDNDEERENQLWKFQDSDDE